MAFTVAAIAGTWEALSEGYREGTPGWACPAYIGCMDAAGELSQFLTSRRAKITPQQAGLPSYGQRRVPGLRREEVASLAGVSVEYYKRMERGNAAGASDSVLDALADALRECRRNRVSVAERTSHAYENS